MTAPLDADASRSNPESDSAITLRTISALGTQSSEAFHAATNFDDLLRDATAHCRSLVKADVVRIWIKRRRGLRLVAREFPGDSVPRIERQVPTSEGLAGWVVTHERALRLDPGEPRPDIAGETEPFRAALVIPLLRRGEVFGAIECLIRHRDGGFTTADFDHLEIASEHIAFALDNALLYEQTERRALEKEMLLEVARTIATPLDLDEVIVAIFKALHQVVDYDAAAIYLVDRKTRALELVSEVGYHEGSEEGFRLEVGQGIVGWVAKHGEPAIVPDVRHDNRYVDVRSETRSEIAAPLRVEGRTIGVFNLESDLPDAYYEGHVELLSAFANQAAVAVERARLMQELLDRRRLEKELAIAREIQLSFLPKRAPEIPGFDIAGTTRPHDEVGGDYFDFIPVSDTRLGLAIGDVSGKGIPAALLMAGFRMSLLAEIRNEFAIRAVMRKVNSLMHESMDRDRFVTAFYGVLDHKNHVLIFSNAGHNPPILLRQDGSVEYLTEGGVTLGVLAEARYEERPIAIRRGDVLVLYTDGISEAESPVGELYGTLRIEECVRRLAAKTSQQILEGIVDEVIAWTGEKRPSDDLTLIVVKAEHEHAGRD